jgi:hypothetical protein
MLIHSLMVNQKKLDFVICVFNEFGVSVEYRGFIEKTYIILFRV